MAIRSPSWSFREPACDTLPEAWDKWVKEYFLLDRCLWPVAGIDNRFRRKPIEDVANRKNDRIGVTAREVSPADAALKQRVSGKAVQAEEEAHGAFGMARGVKDSERQVLKGQDLISPQFEVNREGDEVSWYEWELEDSLPIHDRSVVRVHGNWGAAGTLRPGHSCNVVDVSVRDQDPVDSKPVGFDLAQDPPILEPGVDQEGILGVAPPHEIAVLAKEIIDKDRHLELFPERLGRGHTPKET